MSEVAANDPAPSEVITIEPHPGRLSLSGLNFLIMDGGEILLDIGSDRVLRLGPGVTVDEAARGFVGMVNAWFRRPAAEREQELLEANNRYLERARSAEAARRETFQQRVQSWMLACFGEEISADRLERGDRLLEEVFELLQSGDYPRERVLALRDYVWSRPVGEPAQEVGGVQVTLAAYCIAHGLDMREAGETELARIWTKVDAIRAKQAAKPTGSALPIAVEPAPPPPADGLVERVWRDLCEKDDRTSPEEYPDHALITKDELAAYLRWAQDHAADRIEAPTKRAEDTAEMFIQAAVDRAPEPLRRLGEWLANKLDDDDWKTAERMLLGATFGSQMAEANP